MTDLYKMSAMMKDLFPSDPVADRQALMGLAGKPQESVPNTKNYVQESVEVEAGTMPLDIDSVSDFAALAGIRIDEKQKIGSAGQAKGKDPMPTAEPGRTKHPLKDKLVGEDGEDREPFNVSGLSVGIDALDIDSDDQIQQVIRALRNSVMGVPLNLTQREALAPYIDLFVELIRHPELRSRIIQMKNFMNDKDKDSETSERTLTKGEEKNKEKYVKGMKKAKGDFKDRYGKDAEAVMYATATKMAKNKTESIKDRLYAELAKYK